MVNSYQQGTTMFLQLTLLLFIALFYNYYWKRRNLPPGPAPLPVVGNILTLSQQNRWETKFIEWNQKYGSIFTYWLGELPIVAICDYDDMQTYFVKNADIFSDRYVVERTMDLVRGGHYGVIMGNGGPWREHRRFALKVLRDFGLGKNKMEERILSELQHLLESVNKEVHNDEIDFFKYSDIAVGSIINSIISGYRFTTGFEDEFYKMKHLTTEAIKSFTSAQVNLVFNNPWMLNVPIINRYPNYASRVMKELFAFLDYQINKHIKENDYTHDIEPSDYIDAFLSERERQIRTEGNEGNFTMNQLRNVCMDLWIAGQETTSSTITWIIAYIINHPEVQEKLQKELDTVIGSKRIIKNSDRPNLPYTNAVIMECQRCCNLLSQNIPRCATEDVEISGYKFRKNTIFVPQISVLLQNPSLFPIPEKFNPDRFINAEGKLRQVEELIPFSLGKRICLGEGMARMELFIFTANLFNQYEFSSGKVPPSLQKMNGASTMTIPYNCKVQIRHSHA
ncbi:unnamed protein product [Bursaphelenchus okinawaensis]|uniref:CYtochrome P450 family n=1 Tax=Bursaphelenchus okinawaensis TaxID=465554 RepID=A0A811KR16_9BILA|nr:unnamed protein product [Bursaphelenchus okinawaensis]CAG9109238.1 unnamed protein product [Bursaphelenchus okinawaensis]